MIERHLELLGMQAEDIVTGIKGVVDSICFDAYGCVQATIKQKANKDGKIPEGYWFDVKRLKVTGPRVLDAPPHFTTPPGQEIGAADKPDISSHPTR